MLHSYCKVRWLSRLAILYCKLDVAIWWCHSDHGALHRLICHRGMCQSSCIALQTGDRASAIASHFTVPATQVNVPLWQTSIGWRSSASTSCHLSSSKQERREWGGKRHPSLIIWPTFCAVLRSILGFAPWLALQEAAPQHDAWGFQVHLLDGVCAQVSVPYISWGIASWTSACVQPLMLRACEVISFGWHLHAHATRLHCLASLRLQMTTTSLASGLRGPS